MKFKIGDLVNIIGLNLGCYSHAQVLRVRAQDAFVTIQEPLMPKNPGVCDKCYGANLSHNGETGEIVCMVKRCGYKHGFDVVIDVFPLKDLVKISEQKSKDQRKALFWLQLKEKLMQGVAEKVITSEQMESILKQL